MKREERLQRWVASWPAAVRLEVEVWLWGMCGHGGRLSRRAQGYWRRLVGRLGR